MHGTLIVYIPNGEELNEEELSNAIWYGIGADYLGRRLDDDESISLYNNFIWAMSDVNTGKGSIMDLFEYDLQFPVVVVGERYSVFRSYVEFKAFMDFYGMGLNEYGWEVRDFHF